MAATLEISIQENIGEISRNTGTCYSFTKAEYIGVVMRPAGAGMKFAGGKRRPDAGHTVGGHAHADACAADENSEG